MRAQTVSCMSTVYIPSTMTTPTMYVCLICTCYQRSKQQQYMYVWCVHAINDENNNDICMSDLYMLSPCVHAIKDESTNSAYMSDVYMLTTMRTPAMCVRTMCTCYQRWEYQQCIYVWFVHAINDDNPNNICMSDVYMLSTMTAPMVYTCPQCTRY